MKVGEGFIKEVAGAICISVNYYKGLEKETNLTDNQIIAVCNIHSIAQRIGKELKKSISNFDLAQWLQDCGFATENCKKKCDKDFCVAYAGCVIEK